MRSPSKAAPVLSQPAALLFSTPLIYQIILTQARRARQHVRFLLAGLLPAAICVNTSFAQLPASTALPDSYFPHQLGDMWEYYVWNGVGDDTLQVTVTLDSLDSQGASHVRHHRQILSPLGPPEFPWFESYVVDTTNRVFGSGWLPPNSLVFELEAQVGHWWFVDYDGGSGGRIARVEEEFPDTIFGQPTTFKLISYYVVGDTSDTTTWLQMYTEHLARGFGTIFRISGELGYNLYLRGCVIAGTHYGDTVLVSVPDNPPENVGSQFTLNQNYPNPFNSSTTITFDLLVPGQVSLIIFDLLGREVSRVFDNEVLHMGRHTAVWPGLRSDGQLIASGVYLITLKAGAKALTRRMVLLK